MEQNIYVSSEYKRTRIFYYSQCAFSYLGAILVSESFLAKYLIHMGFSDALTGIVSSLASFSNVFMLLTLVLINHTKNIKRAVTTCLVTNMVLFLLLYLLPFVALPRRLLVVLVFFCVGIGHAVKCLGNPLLFRWIMFFVDPKKRSDFQAINMIVSLIMGSSLSLIAGLVVDRYAAADNMEGAFRFLAILMTVFTLADLLSFLFMKNVSSEDTQNQRKSLKEVIQLTFRRKGYRCVLLMRILYVVGCNFTAGFVSTFLLNDLGFSFGFVQIMTITGSLLWLSLSLPIGHLADRTSYNTGYRLGVSIAAASFILLIFAKPSSRFLGVAFLLVYRSSMSGTGSTQDNLLFNYVPADCFAQATAVSGVIYGLFGFLSALLAGKLLSYIQASGNMLFGRPVYAQNVLAAISFTILVITILFSKFVLEKQKIERD